MYRAGYLAEGLDRSRVYPGVREVLGSLRERGEDAFDGGALQVQA